MRRRLWLSNFSNKTFEILKVELRNKACNLCSPSDINRMAIALKLLLVQILLIVKLVHEELIFIQKNLSSV